LAMQSGAETGGVCVRLSTLFISGIEVELE
jgi:hypothetical protein